MAMSCRKQGSRPNKLLLLTTIHRQPRRGECARATATHFDKREAVAVEHDQVDFAGSAAKIACHGAQAPGDQEAKRLLFGVPA